MYTHYLKSFLLYDFSNGGKFYNDQVQKKNQIVLTTLQVTTSNKGDDENIRRLHPMNSFPNFYYL